MGINNAHKKGNKFTTKNKASKNTDFKHRKVKVGRKLRPANETDATVTVQRIRIPGQGAVSASMARDREQAAIAEKRARRRAAGLSSSSSSRSASSSSLSSSSSSAAAASAGASKPDCKKKAGKKPGTAAPSGPAVSRRNHTISELMTQSNHYAPTMRSIALAGLREIVAGHPGEAVLAVGALAKRAVQAVSDPEPEVRRAALLLWTALLPLVTETQLRPHLPLIVVYMGSALTHRDGGVREHGLGFMSELLRQRPGALVPHAAQVLPHFSHLLRADPALTSVSDRQKIVGGLRQLLAVMVAGGGAEEPAALTRRQRKDFDAVTPPTTRTPAPLSTPGEVWAFLSDALPSLSSLWLECLPEDRSLRGSSKGHLGLMEETIEVVAVLLRGVSQGCTAASDPSGYSASAGASLMRIWTREIQPQQSSQTLPAAALAAKTVVPLFVRHFVQGFPFVLDPDEVGRKPDDARVVALINAFCSDAMVSLILCLGASSVPAKDNPSAEWTAAVVAHLCEQLGGGGGGGGSGRDGGGTGHTDARVTERCVATLERLLPSVSEQQRSRLVLALSACLARGRPASLGRLASVRAVGRWWTGCGSAWAATVKELTDAYPAWLRTLPRHLHELGSEHPEESLEAIHALLAFARLRDMLGDRAFKAFASLEPGLAVYLEVSGAPGPFASAERRVQLAFLALLGHLPRLATATLSALANVCRREDVGDPVVAMAAEVVAGSAGTPAEHRLGFLAGLVFSHPPPKPTPKHASLTACAARVLTLPASSELPCLIASLGEDTLPAMAASPLPHVRAATHALVAAALTRNPMERLPETLARALADHAGPEDIRGWFARIAAAQGGPAVEALLGLWATTVDHDRLRETLKVGAVPTAQAAIYLKEVRPRLGRVDYDLDLDLKMLGIML